jgi:putative ABC transport system permease protein
MDVSLPRYDAKTTGEAPTRVSNRPLWRTAWRRMRRRPLQYILLVLGVALGVAMMVSVDLANGSAGRAFELSSDAVAGRTTHRLVGGPNGLDETVYTGLRKYLGFELAAPVIEEYVLAPDLSDQPLRLVGIDPFAEPPFRSYFESGQDAQGAGFTTFLTEPNTVLISKAIADARGISLGDTMSLDRSGQITSVRIAGLLAPADRASQRALNNIIFTDISTAQEILDYAGRLSHVDLIVEDEAQLKTISDFVPEGVQLEEAAARSNALLQMSAAFELNLTALSLLALIVGMFLIYNTVTFSVIQQRRLFGILRCLGVTGGQLFAMIVAEAAVLGLVGALLGLGAGILLGRGMVRLVSQTINDFYFVVSVQSIDLPPAALVRGLIIGVLAAVFASIVPAWEAMQTSPQNSLYRSTLESRARRATRWLLLAFVLLAAAGVFLLWLPGANLIITFAGLFAVLIACAFLTPGLTSGFMQLTTPISGRLLGAIGRMAPRDIQRSLSRTSVAIAALMIAVSVIVGVSIMIGSFRETVSTWLSQTLQADVFVSPPALTASRTAGSLPPDTLELIQNSVGIRQIVTAAQNDIMAPELGRPIEVIAVSGDVSGGNRDYAWIAGDRDSLWQRFMDGQGIMLSEPLLLREDLGVPPPPLTLLTGAGPHDFSVLAVFYDYSSDKGTVLISRDLYMDWWPEPPVTSAGIFVDQTTTGDQLAAELASQFQGRSDIVVQSNQSLRGNALDIFDRTFAITAALQLLAVVVAFIGVLSALMSLQLEKAREFGVLRATGMTVRQLWQLTLLETGLMGLVAGLLAMPAGWILAWVLIYVINRRSFGWTLQMNLEPAYFWQALVVAVGAALLAGVFPALRLSKTVIATAVREE